MAAGGRSSPWFVLAMLSTLIAFASISTDVYLPALPAMGLGLGAPTGTVEWTISAYLIGFSLGQLVWGPIGDRVGRRLPVGIGLALFVVGSAGCALAGSIWAVIGWRVLQAVGASAGVVLGRAMVRDLYEGPKAAEMMSTLMTIMAIAPLVGPLAGGQLLELWSWRAIFWMLVAVGLVTLGGLLVFPETHPRERRSGEGLGVAFLRYGELLIDRRLWGYLGIGGFFYGSIFAYVAGTPFAYIDYHHVSPGRYALLFAASIIGIMGMNFVNSRLVRRLGSDRLLRIGGWVVATAGLSVAVTGWTDLGGLTGLVLPLLVFVAMNGLIVANGIAGALAGFPGRAGAVSALVGAIQYGSGILSSGLVGLFADGTPRPMVTVMAIGGLGCLLCSRLIGWKAPA